MGGSAASWVHHRSRARDGGRDEASVRAGAVPVGPRRREQGGGGGWRMRTGSRAEDGLTVGAVRVGSTRRAGAGLRGLLQRGAEGGPEPRLPLRRHALRHRQERRSEAGSGRHHSQAVQPCEPPRGVPVRRLHNTVTHTARRGGYLSAPPLLSSKTIVSVRVPMLSALNKNHFTERPGNNQPKTHIILSIVFELLHNTKEKQALGDGVEEET